MWPATHRSDTVRRCELHGIARSAVDIAAWLRELGLERYETAFRSNDIDVDLLSDLTEADLERLGVASLGHRKKLLRAIEALRPPEPEVSAGATVPRWWSRWSGTRPSRTR